MNQDKRMNQVQHTDQVHHKNQRLASSELPGWMRLIACCLCSQAWLVVVAAQPSYGQSAPKAAETTNRTPADEGFVALFDGHSLDGWSATPENSSQDWTVENGSIVAIGSQDRQSYLVWKDRHIKDFELRLRYRLLTHGNTGIEIRAIPDHSGRRPLEGYHADIGHVDIGPNILGAWDLHFAKQAANQRKSHACPRGTHLTIDERDKPTLTPVDRSLTAQDVHDRDWNDVKVVARGYHFQFYLNGKHAASLTDNAAYGRLAEGGIGLQIHDRGMRVEFKDIFLKRLY